MYEGKNFKALQSAGMIPPSGGEYTEAEKAAIESLSDQEIEALLKVKDKVGVEFFVRNAAIGYY